METWLVQLTFKHKPDASAMALVPQERAHVDTLMREGKITARYIARDNSRIWLVFAAPTLADVEAMLEQLPMHAWFNMEIIPVM